MESLLVLILVIVLMVWAFGFLANAVTWSGHPAGRFIAALVAILLILWLLGRL